MAPSTDDERALIARAKTDAAAFARLYRDHYPAVAGALYRRLADRHLAEDLAAETFLSAYRAIGRFRHRGVPFRAWLLRIATNKANQWARRDRPALLGDATDPPGRPDRACPVETDDESRRLAEALRRLSPEHQSVVSLVYFESMSIALAAEVLGVREGTVKSRLARARESLKAQLGSSPDQHRSPERVSAGGGP